MSGPLGKVRPFLSWEKLSTLRSMEIMKIGYFGVIGVPLAAYLIVYIKSDISTSASLPMTFFWLYLGSVILSFGHFLNEVTCPQLIQDYSTLEEYRTKLARYILDSNTITEATDQRYSDMVQNEIFNMGLFDTLDATQKKEFSDAFAKSVTSIREERTGLEAIFSGYQRNWEKSNNSRLIARCIIAACYCSSGVIAFGLIMRQFFTVINATFG